VAAIPAGRDLKSLNPLPFPGVATGLGHCATLRPLTNGRKATDANATYLPHLRGANAGAGKTSRNLGA
jgi:hypothetical protein